MITGVAIAMIVVLGAAACGSSGHANASTQGTTRAAAMKPISGGSLEVGIPTETAGWNPALDQWDDTSNLVASTIFEPLATAGADSGAKPWLATSWIANTTFTRWVIHLRSGVQFQDDTPLNAQAVVDNLHAYLASVFYKLTVSPMFKDEKALDDSTVQVDLTQPWAAFPSSFLDSASAYMMAPSMLAAGAAGANHPIGTGPFVFSAWDQNSTFSVSRNPHYWGGLDAAGHVMRGTPYLDSIEFKVITDDSTRAQALQSGDLDMLTTIDASTANSLASSYTEVKDWDGGSVFAQPNTAPTVGGKPNPMADIHARLALAYATDAKAVARLAGNGLNLATSPFGPNTPWGMPSDQNGYVSFDLAKAKAEVADYEKDTGNSSLTITLLGLANIDASKAMQALAEQWNEAGIITHIESLDQTARITAIVTGNYQVTYSNNYGYPDPDNDYYFWTSATIKPPPGISINFAHYGTAKIDADLTTGRQNGYPSERRAAYEDLVHQLNAGVTHIWLYYTPFTYIAQRKVQGLDAPQGPGHIPFGNFVPKTWWSQIWLSH